MNARDPDGNAPGNAAPWSWLWSAGLAHRLAVALAGIGVLWLVILLTIAAD